MRGSRVLLRLQVDEKKRGRGTRKVELLTCKQICMGKMYLLGLLECEMLRGTGFASNLAFSVNNSLKPLLDDVVNNERLFLANELVKGYLSTLCFNNEFGS